MCVKYDRYLTGPLLSRSEKLSYDSLFQKRPCQGRLSQFPDTMRRPDRRNEVFRFSIGQSSQFKKSDIRTGKDGGHIGTYHIRPRPIRIPTTHSYTHPDLTHPNLIYLHGYMNWLWVYGGCVLGVQIVISECTGVPAVLQVRIYDFKFNEGYTNQRQ